MQLRLLLFSARFEVRDALLGFPIGSAVRLEYPNGESSARPSGRRRADLESLPRGDYRVSVDALGHLVLASGRAIARPGGGAQGDQLARRRGRAAGLWRRSRSALLFVRRPEPTPRAAVAAVAAATLAVAYVHRRARGRAAEPARSAVRLLLHLVQRRLLGPRQDRLPAPRPLLERRARSDAQHIQWAKQAGIDGFIVSWKSTPVLNRRLERLVEVADAERFKLLVIYQGLDFDREPLPASGSRADLDFFSSRFADDQAFDVFDKPLVIWSGTWRFSRARDGEVTEPRRGTAPDTRLGAQRGGLPARGGAGRRQRLLLVSVNPRHLSPATPRSSRRWARRSTPAAASGSRRRRPASTRDWSAARASSSAGTARRCARSSTRRRLVPDAVGLISWNEFSENTHIEPSREHGSRYLEVVADVRGARLPELRDFDSSEPAATESATACRCSAEWLARALLHRAGRRCGASCAITLRR